MFFYIIMRVLCHIESDSDRETEYSHLLLVCLKILIEKMMQQHHPIQQQQQVVLNEISYLSLNLTILELL